MTDTELTPPEYEIFSVSALNESVKALIEYNYPLIWVEGEISNLAQPASGHLYFTLKDKNAQIRCAMFRNRNLRLGFTPANGDQIQVRAKVSLYTGRGEYQLIVEHMEDAGEGLLLRAFEKLKARLDKEGLFHPFHKKELPALPQHIAVITSPTGAAIKDVLSVLKRRYPLCPVTIFPAPVQGESAAIKVVQAIQLANLDKNCDVILLVRGGGSLEDLWTFNEEIVARAIYESATPIITGIGHETDFTIADLVADLRAPTPSVAAETASPNQDDWLETLNIQQVRFIKALNGQLETYAQKMDWAKQRLLQQHPKTQMTHKAQRLATLTQQLKHASKATLQKKISAADILQLRLGALSPQTNITHHKNRCHHFSAQLLSSIRNQIKSQHGKLANSTHALDAVSPLATLARGYNILTQKNGKALMDSSKATPGEKLNARLHKGSISVTVDKID